jgi:hypothetical protein
VLQPIARASPGNLRGKRGMAIDIASRVRAGLDWAGSVNFYKRAA